ncbi:hypothetical protein ACS0PU_012999 [Formica fusca]
MLATQLREERGDAYVALESVMRAHARGEGVREKQCGQRNGNSREGRRERETGRDGKEGGGDKRNVESKKQKERKNKSAPLREPGEGEAEGMKKGKRRDIAGR